MLSLFCWTASPTVVYACGRNLKAKANAGWRWIDYYGDAARKTADGTIGDATIEDEYPYCGQRSESRVHRLICPDCIKRAGLEW